MAPSFMVVSLTSYRASPQGQLVNGFSGISNSSPGITIAKIKLFTVFLL